MYSRIGRSIFMAVTNQVDDREEQTINSAAVFLFLSLLLYYAARHEGTIHLKVRECVATDIDFVQCLSSQTINPLLLPLPWALLT